MCAKGRESEKQKKKFVLENHKDAFRVETPTAIHKEHNAGGKKKKKKKIALEVTKEIFMTEQKFLFHKESRKREKAGVNAATGKM